LDYSLLIALPLGLFTSLHCMGMCGGIIGMLGASLPPEVRGRRGRLLAYTGAYSAGRVLSYATAGALAGGLSETVVQAIAPDGGPGLLRVVAALVVIAMGLYLAGWMPRLALLEHIGTPLWRRLEPLGRRLLPVSTLPHALLFGVVWGWLPCSFVYQALLLALAAGDALQAAGFMALFGVGTLPLVMGAGILSSLALRLRRLPWLRQALGGALIALGLAGLWLAAAGHHSSHGIHTEEHLHQ
jgi:hypothetical protein